MGNVSTINVDGISWLDKGMSLFLARRKNDQMRKGSDVFISEWQGALCSVPLTKELIR